MVEGDGLRGLELRSRISKGGVLELSLHEAAVPEPAADEVIVRVEATPINPSDIGVLLGPAALDRENRWSYELLRARGNSIEGGTTEVLKNIVAERVLGLPKAR